MKADERVSVAVIGAGIGGLTLAIALRRRGIAAEVYEQAPRLTTAGAAVALSANGTRVLAKFGLGDALASEAVEPTEFVYRHWRTGERISSHGMGGRYREAFGGAYYGIHRSTLLHILAETFGAEKIHLDARVESISDGDDGVSVRFHDGRVIEAGLVIGADGAHSVIRRYVAHEADAKYSMSSGFRGLVPRDSLAGLPDPEAIQMWIGPGAHVVHYPCDHAGTVNFLAVVDEPQVWPSKQWRLSEPPGALTSAFKGWASELVEMLAAVPQSERWALFGQEPLRRWSQGRVVLLGDAAHTMLPHHGQGANMTIEDAAMLAYHLPKPSDDLTRRRCHDALRNYERLRRTRTRQVQRSSWDTAAVLHLPDGPLALARDRQLDSYPERFGWIHAYDVDDT